MGVRVLVSERASVCVYGRGCECVGRARLSVGGRVGCKRDGAGRVCLRGGSLSLRGGGSAEGRRCPLPHSLCRACSPTRRPGGAGRARPSSSEWVQLLPHSSVLHLGWQLMVPFKPEQHWGGYLKMRFREKWVRSEK